MQPLPFVLSSWSSTQGMVAFDSSDASAESTVWLHCDRSAKDFEHWLQAEGIAYTVIDSMLANDTRPRFQALEHGQFLLILRGVNLNKGKAPDDMLSIRVLYTPKRLITCNLQPATFKSHSNSTQATDSR